MREKLPGPAAGGESPARTAQAPLGGPAPILDAAAKVTGQLRYVGDLPQAGVLHAAVLFSPCAHARILSIDTAAAEALPGVRAVATHKNAAKTKFNSAARFYEHDIPDTERIFDGVVRHVGDRVAAVAADTPEIARAALKLIRVEYEPLPACTDPEQALRADAFPIHGQSNTVATIRHSAGDVDEAFKEPGLLVFEDRYTTPAVHQGAIEPHVAVARYDACGKLTLTAPCQNTFAWRIVLCRVFGLPMSRVRVHSPAIGGAFGAKLELTLELVAAQLSIMCGQPVRLEYTRRECFFATRTRHASVVYVKTGVRKDGTLAAQELRVITNTGAYCGSALNVLGALSHKVFKVYNCSNMRFVGMPVYTNTPPAGAMRGYGSPQAFFGQQRQMAKIAKALGMPLAELQQKNLVQPNALDPAGGYPLGNPRPQDCLARCLQLAQSWPEADTANGRYKIGTGLAVGAHGSGCFGAHRDQTCIQIKMNEDGSCILMTGSHDMGNGSWTLQTRVVADVLKLPPEKVGLVAADSDAVPWNLGDYASRGVYVQAAAAKKAAETVRAELLKEAALLLGAPPEELELAAEGVLHQKTGRTAPLCAVMLHAQNVSRREIVCSETHAMAAGPTSYGVHMARVAVDTETGAVRVLDYAAVHDVGRVLNRLSIEGQLEGAIQMGIGYALSEGCAYDENGTGLYGDFRKCKMPTASQMPRIQVDFIEAIEPTGPYGAKSIGEAAVVPAAPAIINAVNDALGEDICDLPYRHLAPGGTWE